MGGLENNVNRLFGLHFPIDRPRHCHSLHYMQEDLRERTGFTVPAHLSATLLMNHGRWIRASTMPMVFMETDIFGGDYVSIAEATQTVCVLPSANENADPARPYAIKITGIVHPRKGKPRVVAASYSASGILSGANVSVTAAEFPNPHPYPDRIIEPEEVPRILSEQERFLIREYHQLIDPKERVVDHPFGAAGLITEIMLKRTGHTHFLKFLSGHRAMHQPDEVLQPFTLSKELYATAQGLSLTHDPETDLVTITQDNADITPWEVAIPGTLDGGNGHLSDGLVEDPFAKMVPPIFFMNGTNLDQN